jgi:hypothetical protein
VWILVVEDETSMREPLRQGLEEKNYTWRDRPAAILQVRDNRYSF